MTWLRWLFQSWFRNRIPEPDRPGDDDQFAEWPLVRAEDVNPEDRSDEAEMRWDP